MLLPLRFFQGKPQFEMTLKQPQDAHLMYGIVRKATRILLNVDDAAEFYQEVHKKIENIETVSE
jgi:hypothetical protein